MSTPTKTELPAKYVPAEHEPAVSARWDAAGAFKADPARVLSGETKPYSIIIPPPNVTAALHLGHALNNTLQDVLIRYHRMKGFETLWMPGTDHAGIATQTVVEKRVLAEEGKKRTDFERDEFIAKIQAFKDEYEERITDQLKAMGCSCDWGRQRFTMDEICAKAVREAFFRLFKDGLIYRGKRLVNWDPVTQTALADDEVENEEIEGIFAYLRYPLVHEAKPGDHSPVTWSELAAKGYPGAEKFPEDDQAFVTVATTRPETYLGDTAVAVNPTDPRAGALKGLRAELPLVGRVIPIIEDSYVVLPVALGGDENDAKAKMATGFLKVTPAHDPNDWEIGQRHELPVINVMAPDASISADHGWDDYDPHHGAHVFVGLSRENARQKVLDEFKARGLLEAVKPHVHSVGHSYRSHAAIEPYLSDQWYVKVTDDRLRAAALRAMTEDQRTSQLMLPRESNEHDGKLRFYPDRYAKTFEQWHENLRDWCISRQLWWGHRIPVWSVAWDEYNIPKEQEDQHVLNYEVWIAEGRISFGGPPTGSESKLDRCYVCIGDPKDAEVIAEFEKYGFTQDPDVLDTWFSSALWPMSTMGWPDADKTDDQFDGLLGAFNPSSVLTTAREIITLWVSRMVMFNRYLLAGETDGQLPFPDVFIHAMIQDGEGRKMSKSLGNGVDPLDIIESHGTDAMRYTLCEMTTQTQDVRMPVEKDPETGKNTSPKFDKGRNFCTKLYNAANGFVIRMLSEHTGGEPASVAPGDLSVIDRWMLSRLARATKAIDEATGQYQFSVYAQQLFDVLRADYCDWYLEGVKPTMKTAPAQRVVIQQVLETILRLLHPVTPFITEVLAKPVRELRVGAVEGVTLPDGRDPSLLCTSGWPGVSETLIDEDAEARFERMQNLVDAIRKVRAQHKVPPRRQITLHADPDMVASLSGLGQVTETLAGLDAITTSAPEGEAVPFDFDGVELKLSNLADEVDADTERERLQQQLKDLNGSIGALEKRLSNPGYTDKAPAHLVEETRKKLEQQQAEREAVNKRLGELG
ncbi:MAG: valine--tRNA ligase [Phycisphaera sp.]|nr:MAG: valine--tRNA ligase [Phycisphaera sp.]